MSDINQQLAGLLKLPDGTVSATLQMQAGAPPILTVTRFVGFGDLDESVYSRARFELVAIDDQRLPDRLDTTTLDDGGAGSSVCS